MNKEQFDEYKEGSNNNIVIAGHRLKNKRDRTLILGTIKNNETVHIYIQNEKITLVKYSKDNKLLFALSEPNLQVFHCLMDYAYPEACDLEFSIFLRLAGQALNFIDFSAHRYSVASKERFVSKTIDRLNSPISIDDLFNAYLKNVKLLTSQDDLIQIAKPGSCPDKNYALKILIETENNVFEYLKASLLINANNEYTAKNAMIFIDHAIKYKFKYKPSKLKDSYRCELFQRIESIYCELKRIFDIEFIGGC